MYLRKRAMADALPRELRCTINCRSLGLSLCLLVISLVTSMSINAQDNSPTPPKDQKAQEKPAMDPKADQILRQMSDYLTKLPAMSFSANSSLEVVADTGQKIEFDAQSKVSLQRPNRLRSDRKGAVANLSFYYDGKNVALYGKDTKYYATTNAPPTIDEMIDTVRANLGIEAPAADFLYRNPYQGLTEDVVSSMYIGKTSINGVGCHHLAFRGNETDWQIWISDGPKPLPVKYVIVSKKVAQSPEYVVELQDWNTSPKIAADLFSFKPPKGAMRIEFAKASPKTSGSNK